MKILLTAIGTRGDIEPFLAIAELLVKNNHSVICCFPEQFRKITEECGFPFSGMTEKYLDMLESKEGIIAMGGKANFLQKIKAYYFLFKKAGVINKIMAKQQKEVIELEKPDKIVHHIKAIYPLIYGLLHPNKTILVSPIPYIVHPVKEHAHIGFKNMGRFINKITYKIANYGLLKNIQSTSKGLYDKKRITSKKISSAITKEKTVFTISPFLFKKPDYWSNDIQILGYHERNKTQNWSPKNSLIEFLKRHKSIVFITFGSMVNGEPQKKTELIIKVLEKLNVPSIINTGYGGLVEIHEKKSNNLYFTSNIPYDWLLPQIDYMVHHGGSGTTHMAMKYNCPSVIIPHIIDQFLWNDLNSQKGFGPKGVSINKLNETKFESLLTDLISISSYKEKAKLVSDAIKNENFKEELLNFILKCE